MTVNHQIVEETDAGKLACPVLQTIGGGDSADEFNVAAQAKTLRKQLKHAFPGHKFNVRSDNFSGGSSIRVSWTNGPTTEAVEAIANQYQSVTREECTGEILLGGNRYVSCDRNFSLNVFQDAVEALCNDWGVTHIPQAVRGDDDGTTPHLRRQGNPQRVGSGVGAWQGD